MQSTVTSLCGYHGVHVVKPVETERSHVIETAPIPRHNTEEETARDRETRPANALNSHAQVPSNVFVPMAAILVLT